MTWTTLQLPPLPISGLGVSWTIKFLPQGREMGVDGRDSNNHLASEQPLILSNKDEIRHTSAF